MTDKKNHKPVSIKLWIGLEEDVRTWAKKEGIPFHAAVNHLLDRGLHQASYKFPFHTPKISTNGDSEEEENGSET